MIVIATVLILSLLGAVNSVAQTPQDAVLIDGLAALAGGQPKNEADAVPILLSDIDFAAVLLMGKDRDPIQSDASLDDQVRTEARRAAVLIHLLAQQAKQLKETPDPEQATALRQDIIARFNGKEGMHRLLKRFGMTEAALDHWIDKIILAAKQIHYAESQIELSADEAPKTQHRMSESKPQMNSDIENGYDSFRRLIIEERSKQAIERWLENVIKSGNIRIVK